MVSPSKIRVSFIELSLAFDAMGTSTVRVLSVA